MIRKELETLLGRERNRYKRIISRIRELISKIKGKIKEKNRVKIGRCLARKVEERKKALISSLPEECAEYSDLRVLKGVEIAPEQPKPPVIMCPELSFSKEEIKVLAKSPKYAVRELVTKEEFMAEVEKSLIKEKYGRIGK